ncbi:hypothetical protein [Kitasatospora sp. NPDC059673]|uniref:hypothetical protein n=1 Tax=Kitasatospora sp. NPDC059673 TaxID=3346901 RepID=UPI00368ADF65
MSEPVGESVGAEVAGAGRRAGGSPEPGERGRPLGWEMMPFAKPDAVRVIF